MKSISFSVQALSELAVDNALRFSDTFGFSSSLEPAGNDMALADGSNTYDFRFTLSTPFTQAAAFPFTSVMVICAASYARSKQRYQLVRATYIERKRHSHLRVESSI